MIVKDRCWFTEESSIGNAQSGEKTFQTEQNETQRKAAWSSVLQWQVTPFRAIYGGQGWKDRLWPSRKG